MYEQIFKRRRPQRRSPLRTPQRSRRRTGQRDVPSAAMGAAAVALRMLARIMAARARRESARRTPMRTVPRMDPAEMMRAGTAQMSRIGTARTTRVAGGLSLAAAGIGVVRWMASRPGTTRDRSPKNRWIMVTVNCSPQRLASRADLPEPITRLGDSVDIKISPAPGDRGTELGARLREYPRARIAGMVMRRSEEDPRLMVEEALREAKAMIEAGEAIRPDWPPVAQPVPSGKLLEFAGRRGGRS
jgi:hypothetical protein